MLHRNKVAVVTGGSQGIGKGIAEKLENEGARVIIGSRNSPETKFSGEIDHQTLDVADENSITQFFDIKKSYGRLDI